MAVIFKQKGHIYESLDSNLDNFVPSLTTIYVYTLKRVHVLLLYVPGIEDNEPIKSK